MPRKPDPKVHTIEDCPETIALVKKLYRPKKGYPVWGDFIKGFSISQTGQHLHFSRAAGYDPKGILHQDTVWAQWIPRKSHVLRLVHAATCPKNQLPPIALQEPDYAVVNLKFIGLTRVMSAGTIAREIAIARLEGKL